MTKIYIPVFCLLISGCAATKPIAIYTPFDSKQAESMLVEGKNTIRGSALMRQNNGATVTCAGNEVNLTPATLYALERMLVIYGSAEKGVRLAIGAPKLEDANPRYLSLSKKTVCDAQGFFRFQNVGDGDFFVTTTVAWRTNPYFIEGGSLMQRVEIKGGKEVEIVLAP
jgi:hypothetical protein